MKAKRRSPLTGPLVTFGLMIASIVAIGTVARYFDSHQTDSAQTIATTVARLHTGGQ